MPTPPKDPAYYAVGIARLQAAAAGERDPDRAQRRVLRQQARRAARRARRATS